MKLLQGESFVNCKISFVGSKKVGRLKASKSCGENIAKPDISCRTSSIFIAEQSPIFLAEHHQYFCRAIIDIACRTIKISVLRNCKNDIYCRTTIIFTFWLWKPIFLASEQSSSVVCCLPHILLTTGGGGKNKPWRISQTRRKQVGGSFIIIPYIFSKQVGGNFFIIPHIFLKQVRGNFIIIPHVF